MKHLLCLVFAMLISSFLHADGGHSHHVLVRPDGSMWSWGANDFGQLGSGNHIPSAIPVEIGAGNIWVAFARGQFHTIALDDFGRVWSWGSNEYGQLGLGHQSITESPTLIAGLEGISSIAAGAYHSLAATKSGNLFTWGRNEYGQLGDGTQSSSDRPIMLGLGPVIQIKAGADHSLAILGDNSLYAWGSNGYGQLGNNSIVDSYSPVQVVGAVTDWSAISCGLYQSFALEASGNLWAWGKNVDGELGLGTTNDQAFPAFVVDGTTQVSAGTRHSLFIGSNAGLFGMGGNNFQQSTGSRQYGTNAPLPIETTTKWSNVDAGEYHNVVESGNGEVFSFGRNDRGQAGVGWMNPSSGLARIFGPMSRFKNENSTVFDGTDDFVAMPFNAVAGLSEQFTVSSWFKLNNTDGSSSKRIIMTESINSNGGWGFGVYGTELIFTAFMVNDYITTMAQLRPNTWYHAVAVYDASFDVSFYLNGIFIEKVSYSSGIIPNVDDGIRIGANNSSEFWEGSLNNISIWNKALAPNEITVLHNNGTPNDLSLYAASSNLLAWWNMGDIHTFPKVKDLANQDNDGVMTNMTVDAIVATYPSFNQHAVVFNGIDQGVDLGPVLSFDQGDSFSLSTWFKTFGSGNQMSLINNVVDGTDVGIDLSIQADGNIIFKLSVDGTASGNISTTSSNLQDDGLWHHIVVTYDGSGSVSGINMIVDDTYVSTQDSSNSSISGSMVSAGNLSLGGQSNPVLLQPYMGYLDEVSIWNKELSAMETSIVYSGNAQINLKHTVMSANLVGWWRMGDGDVGNTIKDHSMNANHGTMVNGPRIIDLSARPFQLLVDTALSGTSTNTQFTLPLRPGQLYDFVVEWGDGSINIVASDLDLTHNYTSSGDYLISITENSMGGFPSIYFNGNGDRNKVLELAAWGSGTWNTFFQAFRGCSVMDITAADSATAKTGSVSDFYSAWNGCQAITSFPLIDTSSGSNFGDAWNGLTSITSFPLIDMSSATHFDSAWRNCNGLTNFPNINTSNVTSFNAAWLGCSSLTSFPLIDTSNGYGFNQTWQSCSSLTSFPMIDISNGLDFGSTWDSCTGLTSFPLLDTSKATNFENAWRNCTSLTSFPQIDSSKTTNFINTWNNCIGLNTSDFPLLSMGNMNNGTACFQGVTLSTNSYSDLIINIDSTNNNTSVIFDGGNSELTVAGNIAKQNLINTKSWTITDGF